MKRTSIALAGGLLLTAGAIALPDTAEAQRGGYYYDHYAQGYSPYYYDYRRDYRPRYGYDNYDYRRRDRRSYYDYRPQKRRPKYKEPRYKETHIPPSPNELNRRSRADQGGE